MEQRVFLLGHNWLQKPTVAYAVKALIGGVWKSCHQIYFWLRNVPRFVVKAIMLHAKLYGRVSKLNTIFLDQFILTSQARFLHKLLFYYQALHYHA